MLERLHDNDVEAGAYLIGVAPHAPAQFEHTAESPREDAAEGARLTRGGGVGRSGRFTGGNPHI